MYYCFVIEDILNLDEADPLSIQINYAKRLGQCCFCDLSNKKILDAQNNEISVAGQQIFLRATCDNTQSAISLVLSKGGMLLEDTKSIEKIEQWPSYINTVRKIIFVPIDDTGNIHSNRELMDIVSNNEKLFIKSVKKGFNAVVSSKRILDGDKSVLDFITSKCKESEEILMVSPFCEIKKDSLGKKEARFFVLKNSVLNSSRMIHSLKHSVPKSLIRRANEIVDEIGKNANFPQNYVLDVAEFVGESENFIDVVEINPLTNSMCYINNSIYQTEIEEIKEVVQIFGAGKEYCYDFIENRERYALERYSGESYEYFSDESYEFL